MCIDQLKSANESVRLDAMNLFKSLSTKSTNGSDVAEVIDVFAKAITGNLTPVC